MATKNTKNPKANETHKAPLGARKITASVAALLCLFVAILPWIDPCPYVQSVVNSGG